MDLRPRGIAKLIGLLLDKKYPACAGRQRRPAYGDSVTLFVMTVSIYDVAYVARPALNHCSIQGIPLNRHSPSTKDMSN